MSYGLSVRNADSSGCPASTFAISSVVPAGWTGVVSPATLTLSPGASGQGSLTVTASSVATSGSYAVTANVVNAALPASLASASGTYTVQSTADTLAPTAPSGLRASVNQKQKKIQLTWNGSTDNVAVAGYWVARDGTTVGTVTSTGWVDSAWTAGATYTYSIFAYDASGNVSPASNTVTVTLSGGAKKRP